MGGEINVIFLKRYYWFQHTKLYNNLSNPTLSPPPLPLPSLHLSLFSSPHITAVGAQVSASPSVSSVAEGGRVQFEFRVRGSPFPTVEWFKTNIGDNFRIDLSPKLENGEWLVDVG